MKRNFKGMLVAILTVCGAMNVYAEESYTIERLSNPTFGVGQLDGYIAGGQHGNDYTQSMAVVGDNIYIATSANIGYAFTRRYNPNWNFWYILSELYNGRFPFYDPNDEERLDGSRIIAYNTKSGEFSVIYSGENGVGFRTAATGPDGNYAYFAAYSADSRVSPYILKVDKRGNCVKLFETRDCVALHGSCTYNGRLYFGGADEREDATSLTVKPTKFAVLEVHSSSCVRVADYTDFGNLAYDEIFEFWNDSPIWSLASHGGYIYATMPSSAGFVVFRGRPATDAEKAAKKSDKNANNVNLSTGWIWEEVAGPSANSLNNPGLSDVPAGVPGVNMLSGSLYDWNGQLYAYNFDHSIMGELSVFVGGIKTLTETRANAIDYLNFMYTLLQNPQKVWRLNDLTGKFELQQDFTQHMLSTLNGRVGEYNGQLYVATMDAGHLYSWLSQFAVDDFIRLTPAEIIAKLSALSDLVQTLTRRKTQDQFTQTLLGQLEQLQALLLQFLKDGVDKTSDEASVTDFLSLEDIIKLINLIGSTGINNPTSGTGTTGAGSLADIINIINSIAAGTAGSCCLTDILSLSDILKVLGLSGLSGLSDITKIEDIINLPNAEWKTLLDAIIVKILQEKLGITDGIDLTNLEDLFKLDLTSFTDYRDLLDEILKLIQDKFGDKINIGDITDATLADLINLAFFENLRDNILALIAGINSTAIGNYVFIFNRMLSNKMGFDLMRTSNGYDFEYITRDGFGDKFNYGCPSFATTAKGLYIGTSNPFFGGQLHVLSAVTSGMALRTADGDDADAIQTVSSTDAQTECYTLDGRRVNAKSAQKGIFIQNGKKILK